ncbi:MAG TPA: ABC transporter ATP-binding protein [Candidatus Elarobacter sp.]|jgi:ABC-2 type transport system ATP-binding protein|nr:ABC transporter ATP-binding protein [Candidatus Elarobacter sp.]
MRDAMLTVEHVDKSFPVAHGFGAMLRTLAGHRPPRRQVLFDVNLSVGRGELFGLLGPNGAGKSTLLKLLATLTVPDRGRMTIDGIDVAAEPLEAKRRIALCASDERSFYFRLSARENLMFFGALMGLSGEHLRKRVDECVERVDLTSHIDRRVGGFSSGMRVRLTVARALLADPSIIFFDEPTRAVDPVHAEDLRKLIRHDLVEHAGKTVILATNLLEEAWEVCDRVAIVNRGRIVAMGPPRELGRELGDVAHYRVTLDDVDEDLLARTRTIPGFRDLRVVRSERGVDLHVEMDPTDGTLGALMRAVSWSGAPLRDFRPIDPEAIDVFKNAMDDGDHG